MTSDANRARRKIKQIRNSREIGQVCEAGGHSESSNAYFYASAPLVPEHESNTTATKCVRVCVGESPENALKIYGVRRDREHSVPRHRHTYPNEYVCIYLCTYYVWMCVRGIIHVFR